MLVIFVDEIIEPDSASPVEPGIYLYDEESVFVLRTSPYITEDDAKY